MIRILHVLHKMECAGTQNLIMSVYRKIDRSNIQFDFAVRAKEKGYFDDEIYKLGGQIYYYPNIKNVGIKVSEQALYRIMRQRGPYVAVHSHSLLNSGYVLRAAWRAGVKKRIAHSHNNVIDHRPYRIIFGWYMRPIIRKYATHLLAVSRPAAEWLYGKRCWKDSRLKIINNAINLSPFGVLKSTNKLELRKALSLPEESILIGNVGRFEQQKNHRFVIDVFFTLQKKLPTSRLVLVGDGSLRKRIEGWLREKEIFDKVFMMGVRTDIPQILNAIDIFLFPSLYEGLGIALIEAQAAGIPCIVSNKVPKDADIGLGLVKFLKLDTSLDLWSKEIIESLHVEPITWFDRQKAIKITGYDIEDVISQWNDLYEKDN